MKPPPSSPILLNDFPPELLVAIIEQIGPLQQLLTKYRGVCKLWLEHIEKLCGIKSKSLILTYPDNKDERLYDASKHFFQKNFFNLREFVRFEPCVEMKNYQNTRFMEPVREAWEMEECFEFIFRLYPDPTELILYFKNPEAYDIPQLIQLLNRWSSTLTIISINAPPSESDNVLERDFCSFLNSCTSLKCLNLDNFTDCFDENLLAPTLARIKQLAFDSSEPFPEQLLSATSDNCTTLYCDSYVFDNPQMAFPNTWLANITHLHLTKIYLNLEALPLIFLRLRSLRVLKMDLDMQLDINFLLPLRSLSKLEELTLCSHDFELFLLPPSDFNDLLSRVQKLELIFAGCNGCWYRHMPLPVSDERRRQFYPTLGTYFPALKTLTIVRPCFDPPNIEEFRESHFPQLQHFEIIKGASDA